MKIFLAGLRVCTLFLVVTGSSALQASDIQERLPIVFAHGIGVPALLYEKVVPLARVFNELGYDLFVARTPIGGSLDERSGILHDEINRLVPTGRFHLIGHSMGGLDSRLAVRRFHDIGSRCASITTLASPHHGSAVADYVVNHLDELGSRSSLVARIVGLFGGEVEAIRDLTTQSVEGRFNSRVGDVPGIRYFSMGFYIPTPIERHSLVPLLWVVHKILEDAGQPYNDGFVSVESAVWGESLGALPADHWSETAPVPFLGGQSYREISARVVRNLAENVERGMLAQ